METNNQKQIVTVKRASQITGASKSFFHQLMRERKLKKYRINTAVYIDLNEFERLAQAQPQHA